MVHDPISGHVIIWYRCGQSTFSSCGHVGLKKSEKEQKHHRTTAPKDKNQGVQDPQNGQIFYYSNHQGARSHFWSCDHMIQVWTINILVMRSRGRTEKSQNEQKHHRTTAKNYKNQGRQNPKRCKYFTTPTIKVHDTISGHVITWYRCGQSILVMHGRTQKSHKSIGQQPQRIKIKADKTPKRWKYFSTSTIKVHDIISGHVITWYRCGQSTFSLMQSRGWTEKSQKEQKHHRTTARIR